MTYLEIQNEVKENIIDLPSAIQSRVPSLVNRSMTRLQNKHNFKVMEAEQQFTTTVNVRSLGTMPSDFKEYRDEPFWLEDTGEWHKISISGNERAVRLAFDEELDIGAPLILLESTPSNENNTTTMSVYPLPDGNSDYSDGEYRVRIPYYKYLAALSVDGSSNWFTVNASEYLIMDATALGFLADWDEERMGIWLQLAEQKANEAIKRDKLYRLSGWDTLVPNKDVNFPRLRI